MTKLTLYILKHFTYYVEIHRTRYYRSIIEYDKHVRIYGYDFEFEIDFAFYYDERNKLDLIQMFKLYNFIYELKSWDISTIFIKQLIHNNISNIGQQTKRFNLFLTGKKKEYWLMIKDLYKYEDDNIEYRLLFNYYSKLSLEFNF